MVLPDRIWHRQGQGVELFISVACGVVDSEVGQWEVESMAAVLFAC